MTEQGCIFRGRRGIEGKPVPSGLLEVKSELRTRRPDALGMQALLAVERGGVPQRALVCGVLLPLGPLRVT
jgi:hypothetical protein